MNKSIIAASILSAVALGRNITTTSGVGKEILGAKSGDGDMYILAYSWQAEFCYGESYPGCKSPESYWETHFTLHGLWPEYTAGGYPASCSSESLDSSVFDEIGMDTMTTYWPNVKESEGSSSYDSFWDHEWSKHGTCSGLSQYDYFNDSVELVKSFGTPSVISTNVGGSVSTDDVRDAFGGSSMVALHCTGTYLEEVYTCWGKSSSGHPTEQISCPSDVLSADTCSGSTVKMASF